MGHSADRGFINADKSPKVPIFEIENQVITTNVGTGKHRIEKPWPSIDPFSWCKQCKLALRSAPGTKLTVKQMRLRMLHANPFGSSRKERAADE